MTKDKIKSKLISIIDSMPSIQARKLMPDVLQWAFIVLAGYAVLTLIIFMIGEKQAPYIIAGFLSGVTFATITAKLLQLYNASK